MAKNYSTVLGNQKDVTRETSTEGKKHPIRDYLINVLNGMAWGLFASLLIGLIIRQIGTLSGLPLLIVIGNVAQRMMGPAIGVGVAHALRAKPLVLMSCAAAGALGAGTVVNPSPNVFNITIGEPVGALVAALVAAEVGNRVAGKTKVDIVLVPFVTLVVGGLVAAFVSPMMSQFMTFLGGLINQATELQPIPMGILVSVAMGMILTLPISSAALAISLGLSGLAGGAACVGCCCNMIGFAVASFKENGFGGLIAQGLGTSMLQVPNIIRKPIIWLPAIVASAILGPLSTTIFQMKGTPGGAGMGTSGLVGQFTTIEAMGNSPDVLFKITILHFLLPAVIAFIVDLLLRKKGLVKDGDMSLNA